MPQSALTSIATAVLFAGLLSGCASQAGSLGMTVPRWTDGTTGYCQAERANADVFAQQCESNTSSS